MFCHFNHEKQDKTKTSKNEFHVGLNLKNLIKTMFYTFSKIIKTIICIVNYIHNLLCK